jgi:hypothetical protein
VNAQIAIKARLSSFAGLTALVGTRISPYIIQAPAVWPAVVYWQKGTKTEKGALSDPPLSSAIIQIDSLDVTMLGARTVAAQVMLALDRWRQVTIAGVVVDDCIFMLDLDLFDPVSQKYSVSADFRLYFRE